MGGGVAAAQEPATPDTGFGIQPAREETVGTPPLSLGQTVFNRSSEEYDVDVSTAFLTQGPDGVILPVEEAASLSAARKILTVSPRKFELGAGESRQLDVEWRRLPRGERAAAIGLVVRGKAAEPDPAQVSAEFRLVGIRFLRLPGPVSVEGRLTGLQVEQDAEERVLNFLARLRNTGENYGEPSGQKFEIRDEFGEVVVRETWPGDVVLAGFERDFPIEVRKVLPAGEYTATAMARFGDSPRSRARASFTLTGPNELPVPKLDLLELRASGKEGDSAEVSGRVGNIGTQAGSASVQVALYDADEFGAAAGEPLAEEQASLGELAPDEEKTFDLDVGTVEAGDYLAEVVVTDGDQEFERRTSGFSAAPAEGLLSQLAVPLVIMAVLAVLAVIGVLVQRSRRERERLRAELESLRSRSDTPD